MLGQVPPQDPAGAPALHEPRGGGGDRTFARVLAGGALRRHRARGVSDAGPSASRSCPRAMPEKTPYNPFDLTKVWPHGDYPLIEVGVVELDTATPRTTSPRSSRPRSAPRTWYPGIGFSPDKVLQARIFAYADAHRYRLGTHYEALPVNLPQCPVRHYHKDGAMRFFANDSGHPDAYYEPNSVRRPDRRSRTTGSRPLRALRRRRPPRPPGGERRLRPAPGAPRAARRAASASACTPTSRTSMQGVPEPRSSTGSSNPLPARPSANTGKGWPDALGECRGRRRPLEAATPGGGSSGAAPGEGAAGAAGRSRRASGFAGPRDGLDQKRLLATRNPTWTSWKTSGTITRFAGRLARGRLHQEPPRIIARLRTEPSPGAWTEPSEGAPS